jgi:6-phosphogluconolactonase
LPHASDGGRVFGIAGGTPKPWDGRMLNPFLRRWAPWCLALALPSSPVVADSYMVFVGTYAGPRSEGIYLYRYDSATGVIEELGLAAPTRSPSFLALHPNGRFLYAANEAGRPDGRKEGAITAFAIDPASGRLRELNHAPSVGAGPCHLTVDPAGRQVLAANYGGGSVVSLALEPDGRVGAQTAFHQHVGSSVNAARQKEPHAHSINLAPGARFAYVADLGMDRLLVYPFDPARGLAGPARDDSPRLGPGSGPRHVAVHPSGRHAYVINEMLSTVTVYRVGAGGGRLEEVQTVGTLPEGFSGGSSTAEVVVHPSGRFVYGSNRGHDSLAVFAVDSATGRLAPRGHVPTGGKTPRNFCIDPEGKTLWAANQGSDNIVVFRVDAATGALERTGQELKVGMPVCVRFLRLPR